MTRRIACLGAPSCVLLVLTVAGVCFPGDKAPQGPDPSFYVKRDTWCETMLASREALMREAATKIGPLFSTVVDRHDEPRPVKIPVAGVKTLYIGAFAPKKSKAQDFFIDASLIDKQGKATPLLDLKFGKEKRQNSSGTYRVKAPKSSSGLVETEVFCALDGKYDTLETLVGPAGKGTHGQVWIHSESLLSDRLALVKARRDLWDLVCRDFTDVASQQEMAWETEDDIFDNDWPAGDVSELAARHAKAIRLRSLRVRADALAEAATTPGDLQKVRDLYLQSRRLTQLQQRLSLFDARAMRLAIEDLTSSFPAEYVRGEAFLQKLVRYQKRVPQIQAALEQGNETALSEAEEVLAFQREVLLANPLIDFDRLLVVRRGAENLGLPSNWLGNSALRPAGYDNAIASLSLAGETRELATVFQPPGDEFIGDVDLHFDAGRMLFSMPRGGDGWQVFEINIDGTGLRQVTPDVHEDVDNYDACYLPDGRVIFTSTANMQGVPCIGGSSPVTNLALLDAGRTTMRMLTFDQDHDWCPTLMESGQIMYLRWEYTDIPHAFSRILFTMNPDGTGQSQLYGSNSYWPNGIWYARPIPGHPNRLVGVISGHHGVKRAGELVIFDAAKGRYEADGVVQRIPGHGQKVEPVLLDNVAGNSWPKFLHPYPISDKYFLVAAQPTSASLWGIYLVDVFDNILLLKEQSGDALLEPIPVRKTRRPPTLSDKTDLARTDGTVFLGDIYAGPGLAGVPRGTIKQLRVFAYHFAYRGMGGQGNRVGTDGPWDVKQILGTVPVHADGSALFRVPANTPISVHPLDAEGKAVQRMRSWLTAEPGEVVSCVGCHQSPNSLAPPRSSIAARQPPAQIKPWYGPTRGFSFLREVQRPVLDKYCIGCHHGQPRSDGAIIPDLRDGEPERRGLNVLLGKRSRSGTFTPSYWTLRSFVRNVNETDLHLLTPWEFHADSTLLVQMLQKGHHNVKLDAEAWDRLITWIDLGAPAHGTWTEIVGPEKVERYRQVRLELRRRYANVDEVDPEAIPQLTRDSGPPIIPERLAETDIHVPHVPKWPFDAADAKRRQAAAAEQTQRTIDLGDGVTLELVLIPSGEFVMGDANGHPDERPLTRVSIDSPFWIGKFEVTNAQYASFDPSHDSRLESLPDNHFSAAQRGVSANDPQQPVVRITWHQAMAFCRWLRDKTGKDFTLPTEAQWEYACRAGTATPLSYGDPATDHSPFANLADAANKKVLQWLHPTEGRFDDHAFVAAGVGSYAPNAWGLHDMHGNVAEWTRSSYRPYPCDSDDGRNDLSKNEKKAARGGSWHNRPKAARSAHRLMYHPHQLAFALGFRVVLAVESK